MLLSEYFDIEKQLDNLIAKSIPDENDLAELQALTIKSAHLEYFFRNLNNPEWFLLLKKGGYFKTPISEIHHPDDTISCPSWPQSAYLIKCVLAYPKELADIILNADPTENARVHHELVEVAIALPGPEAARVVPIVKAWIKDSYKQITPLTSSLGKLVAKLAEDKELKAAFDLAFAITVIHVDEARHTRTAKGYVEYWDYAHMIDQFLDTLFKKDPIKSIEFLYRRLNKVLILENRSDKPDEYFDHSYIWRHTIGDDSGDAGVDDLRDILINSLRNYSVQYIDEDKAKLSRVLEILKQSKFPLMKRIQLYLIYQKAHLDDELLHSTISDFSLIDEPNTHNEYYRLLKNTFASLPASTQTSYLDWVMKGPNRDQLRKSRTLKDGEPPSDELLDGIIGYWQLRMFAPITKFLTTPYKEHYESLDSKFGKPEHPEFVSFTTSWTGPTSPLSSDDLKEKSVKEVISYLKKWTPEVSRFAPSPEGLGRFLGDDVKARPNDYLTQVGLFSPTEIRPVYFYHLFMGLRQAVKDNSLLDWNSAFKLSETIIFATNLPEPKATGDDWETGWTGVNKEIAGFISEALQNMDQVPYQFRNCIWKLIEKLTYEPDPTPEFEAKYGGKNMSPVDMSINTGRGEAVHALFRYAFWCDHNNNKGIDEKQQKHAFPPEALAVVNDLLDRTKEPTLTIRSIIGWYLQYLAFLDLKWTQDNLRRIIPEEPQYQELKKAAFEGYFSMNHPNGYIFRNFRGFFKSAYEWATEIDDSSTMHRPRRHYFDHLMTVRRQGILDHLG